MVDRVADDVEQGIAHQLDHLAVQLDVGALDGQRHQLAELPGGIADHARQGGEQCVDPLHAGAGDGIAHVGDGQRQALQRRLDQRVVIDIAQPPRQLVAGEHHVRHAAHHPVEQVDVQPDGAGADARQVRRLH